MKKSILALACASALALALSACAAPTPAATATNTPSITPSASATPTPEPAAQPASIVISSAGFTILDANNQALGEFDYFEGDATAAIAALTTAFGSAPVESEFGSTNHPESNSIISSWAGFELRDRDADASYPDVPSFSVDVTTAEINGVSIRTTDGVQVGMPLVQVEPLSYRNWVDTGTGAEIPIFLLEQLPLTIERGADYEPAAFSVVVSSEAPAKTVTSIGAPGANFGV